MDGASGWQKFRTVTLPFLRPAMLPYAIYGFVITFNLFYLSYFMTGGDPFGRTELLVTQAYKLVNEQPAVRRRGGVLGLPVLPPARSHARHQPAREGDGELCRLTARRARPTADDDRRRSADDRRSPPAAAARPRPQDRGGAAPQDRLSRPPAPAPAALPVRHR